MGGGGVWGWVSVVGVDACVSAVGHECGSGGWVCVVVGLECGSGGWWVWWGE